VRIAVASQKLVGASSIVIADETQRPHSLLLAGCNGNVGSQTNVRAEDGFDGAWAAVFC
jgi:hypothetical protein